MSKIYEDNEIKVELKCKYGKCYLAAEPIKEFEIIEALRIGFMVKRQDGTTGYIPYQALGDTVFLTREQAEWHAKSEESEETE
jgi:hypothetical protein